MHEYFRPDMAVGPIFKTQPNPTHDFTDSTQVPTQPKT